MFPITFTTKFTGLFYSNGKGGAFMTTGVHVCARNKDGDGQEIVDLTGLTSHGKLSKSDIQLSPAAMDQLCAQWIRERGVEFTGHLDITRQYCGKQLLVKVGTDYAGIKVSEVDGMDHSLLAHVDTWHLDAINNSDKDGLLQMCVYDPADNRAGPVACAVYTDEGVKIHVGDGGALHSVEEFDERVGIVSERINDLHYVSKGE